MSKSCEAWVWEKSDTTGNDRLVLLAIADEANDDGTNSYPSIGRIAEKARVNRATVMRSIKRLEERAELAVLRPEEYGRGRFNRYVVLMGRPVEMVAECNLFDVPKKVAQRRVKVAEGRAQVRPDLLTSRPLDQDQHLAPAAPSAEQESVFAALCQACNIHPEALTASGRTAARRAADELDAIGVRPCDLVARVDRYRQRWPRASVTPSALARHWAECESPPPPPEYDDFWNPKPDNEGAQA